VTALLARYQSVPMSVADAILVRMAELSPHSQVFTLDTDFQIYRKNRNSLIPLLSPDISQ
jgi:predicted nucleic acid-binding protein